MKKKSTILFALLLFAAFQTALATKITIITSGFTYSPASSSGAVGDTVTISASISHPLVEVDQTNWNANTPTPVSGGWGTKTTTYSFTIASPSNIYFMCQNHGMNGMKGMINVTGAGLSQSAAVTNSISLFPNPVTNGEFTVKAEGYSLTDAKVVIYNTEGKLMETHLLTGVSTPVKTKLPVGAYFYNVMIADKQVNRGKFVVASGK